jgi:hypothetical protein
MITQQQAIDLFDYEDGNLYWRLPKANHINVGDLAGYINSDGYVIIGLKYRYYGAHRIIFLREHGWLPKIVDHVDGNRSNNKIENLRGATRAQNAANTKKSTRNKSGHKNVSWNKKSNAWTVTIQLNGRNNFIGAFKDLEIAVLAASEHRDYYHRKFARHD